jgi:hypothetical protein
VREILLCRHLRQYLRFERTTLVIRTLLSETASSVLTIAIVFFLFFPFSNTVSPLNNPSSSILIEFIVTVEWSSTTESSTRRLFIVSFLVSMAVAKAALDACTKNGKKVIKMSSWKAISQEQGDAGNFYVHTRTF